MKKLIAYPVCLMLGIVMQLNAATFQTPTLIANTDQTAPAQISKASKEIKTLTRNANSYAAAVNNMMDCINSVDFSNCAKKDFAKILNTVGIAANQSKRLVGALNNIPQSALQDKDSVALNNKLIDATNRAYINYRQFTQVIGQKGISIAEFAKIAKVTLDEITAANNVNSDYFNAMNEIMEHLGGTQALPPPSGSRPSQSGTVSI